MSKYLLAILFFVQAPVNAAVINVTTGTIEGTGELTGATGVNVSGKFYEVEFVEGTCFEVYFGCDEFSDFSIVLGDQGSAASNALIDQVFGGAFEGSIYDENPDLIFGIDPGASWASILTAYTPLLLAATAFNAGSTSAFNDGTGSLVIQHGQDTSTIANQVWARWTEIPAPVPVPAAAWLFGTALIGLVGYSRRRKVS